MPETDPGSSRLRHNFGDKDESAPDSRLRVNMDQPDDTAAPESRLKINMGAPESAQTPDAAAAERRFTNTMGTGTSPEATPAAPERGDTEAILGADAYTVSEIDGRIFAKAGDKSVDVTDYFGAEQIIDRFQPVNPDDPRGPLAHTETVKIVGTQRRETGPTKGELLILATRIGASGRVSIGLDQIGKRDPENGRAWRLPEPEE
jgi:hypothetical protein